MIRRLVKFGDWVKTFGLESVKLVMSYYKLGVGKCVFRSRFGNFFVTPNLSAAVHQILVERVHDIEYKHSDVVLDLGANVGVYTVYVIKRFGVKRVVSVEASPTTFEFLKKNVELNALNNVVLLNKAVHSEDDKEVQLYTQSDFVDTGVASVFKTFTQAHTQHLRSHVVKTVALKTLLQQFQPSVIKVDIEGAEWLIFGQDVSEEMKDVRAVIMEVHQLPGYNVKHMIKTFEHWGFTTTLTPLPSHHLPNYLLTALR